MAKRWNKTLFMTNNFVEVQGWMAYLVKNNIAFDMTWRLVLNEEGDEEEAVYILRVDVGNKKAIDLVQNHGFTCAMPDWND